MGYVNAHGTGTRQNDLVEARGIRAALGNAASDISALKASAARFSFMDFLPSRFSRPVAPGACRTAADAHATRRAGAVAGGRRRAGVADRPAHRAAARA
ncbi:MAG: hypothetical protein ABGY41_17155 [Candidatus Poribacteria bacterium]